MRQLGLATGHQATATKLVRSLETQFTAVIRSVPKVARHLAVYHELEQDYYSATSSTFIGRIYKLFGFKNIADAADSTHSGYPQLSAEYIIASNSGMIVLADSVCCGQSPATVAARPGWSNIAAVTHKRVVIVDDSVASRWGPRLILFAKAIAKAAQLP
jgi:iron complex transport system substrate-binding protein